MRYAIALAALFAATPTFAQQATFNDTLVDHLAGKWVLTGQMDKGQVTHDITAEWVLAHQYLEIHVVSREKSKDGSPVYQAKVFIGWDAGKKTYDCVWLDDYGSISTQSLGYAKPNGNSIAFVFQNRDDAGSFHTTFTRHPETGTWSMDMDSATAAGKTEPFARTTLTAAK
jgi:activator of 2-hydroxyglutaryl-CoA dehydratase